MSPGSGFCIPQGVWTLLHIPWVTLTLRDPVPSAPSNCLWVWHPLLSRVMPKNQLVRSWRSSLCGRDPGALKECVDTCRWAEVWPVSREGRWQLSVCIKHV